MLWAGLKNRQTVNTGQCAHGLAALLVSMVVKAAICRDEEL